MTEDDSVRNPQALRVELAFFHDDALLCRTMIRIEEQEKSEEFDYEDPTEAGTVSSQGHLVIRHRFNLPSSSLYLWLIRHVSPESSGELVLQAAVEMGVHDSEDWESVALGHKYTLAFRCWQEWELA